ncbi:MAG: hypothetical protein IJ877_01855 [Candidatus Gastranaerophilales bacterium]|nr:hypothetical protein [Candidatus Gastranaerophilales bacterium]
MLYEKISYKTSLSQLRDDETLIIHGKKISQKTLKETVKNAQDRLLNADYHNEVNVYKPKINSFIAKVNSLEEIPEKFLQFAKDNDLVIFLLGS